MSDQSDSAAVHHAIADLYRPGWLELGAADIAARTVEQGAETYSWPCEEWTYLRRGEFVSLTGETVREGPLDNTPL